MLFDFTALCPKRFHEFQCGLLLNTDLRLCTFLAAAGRAVYDPHNFQILESGFFFIMYITFYHLAWYSPLLALFIPVQLLTSPIFLTGRVCNCQKQNVVFIFSFTQLYMMMLLLITDLPKQEVSVIGDYI